MNRWRQILAYALCAILAFTAQMLQAARGGPVAVGQIELCTSDGTFTVDVDAGGNPVEHGHICPDCLLHFLSALAAEPPAAQPLRPRTPDEAVAHARGLPASLKVTPVARGPPHRI